MAAKKSVKRRVAACRAHVTRVFAAHGYTNDSIKGIVAAALHVTHTWLQWGPCDDGSKEGLAFEDALTHLLNRLRRSGI